MVKFVIIPVMFMALSACATVGQKTAVVENDICTNREAFIAAAIAIKDDVMVRAIMAACPDVTAPAPTPSPLPSNATGA